jgi:hypothetical protein
VQFLWATKGQKLTVTLDMDPPTDEVERWSPDHDFDWENITYSAT